MAECSTFSTVGAIRLFTVRSVMIASFTLRLRMRSTTRRAFCGDTLICLASALTSMKFPFTCRFPIVTAGLRLRRLFARLGHVPFERAGRGEFAQFVTHHVL